MHNTDSNAGLAEPPQLELSLNLPLPLPFLTPHTLQAVATDNRLRAFFPDDSLSHGLLFGCQGARPLLGGPLGACLAVRVKQGDSWCGGLALPCLALLNSINLPE